jgi:hypothetical protein
MGPVRGRTPVTRSQWASGLPPGRSRAYWPAHSSKFRVGLPRVLPEPECRDQVTGSDAEWDSALAFKFTGRQRPLPSESRTVAAVTVPQIQVSQCGSGSSSKKS